MYILVTPRFNPRFWVWSQKFPPRGRNRYNPTTSSSPPPPPQPPFLPYPSRGGRIPGALQAPFVDALTSVNKTEKEINRRSPHFHQTSGCYLVAQAEDSLKDPAHSTRVGTWIGLISTCFSRGILFFIWFQRRWMPSF